MKCIDNVLTSTSLVTSITSAKYEEYSDEHYTDQTLIAIQLHFECLAGNTPSTLQRQTRRLFSKDQENSRI